MLHRDGAPRPRPLANAARGSTRAADRCREASRGSTRTADRCREASRGSTRTAGASFASLDRAADENWPGTGCPGRAPKSAEPRKQVLRPRLRERKVESAKPSATPPRTRVESAGASPTPPRAQGRDHECLGHATANARSRPRKPRPRHRERNAQTTDASATLRRAQAAARGRPGHAPPLTPGALARVLAPSSISLAHEAPCALARPRRPGALALACSHHARSRSPTKPHAPSPARDDPGRSAGASTGRHAPRGAATRCLDAATCIASSRRRWR